MTLLWHMYMSRNSQQWYSRSHAGCLPALTYLFLSTLISSLTLFLFHLGHTVSHVTLEAFVLCYMYVCLKGSTVFLLSPTFWPYLSKVFSLCGHISRLLFLFSLWPLSFISCDLSFNIHEFKQLQCATFAHDISARYPEPRVFSTHIFLIFLTSPSLSHFLSYTFLFIYLSVYSCAQCVSDPAVFFFHWICVGLWG